MRRSLVSYRWRIRARRSVTGPDDSYRGLRPWFGPLTFTTGPQAIALQSTLNNKKLRPVTLPTRRHRSRRCRMIKLALIGSLLVGLTIVVHALGTTAWIGFVWRRHLSHPGAWRWHSGLLVLVGTGIVLLTLHTVQIVIWAITYQLLLPPGELGNFETAVYFSFVTFATLGYGDITLSEGWRLLSGIESMNGILLVGWSTAVLFAVVQRLWRGSDAGSS